MKTINLLLSLFLTLPIAHTLPTDDLTLPSRPSSPSSSPPIPSGYSIVPLTWSLPLDPSSPSTLHEFNGTVQQVHAQLLSLNPNWDIDFNFNITTSSSISSIPDPIPSSLSKRDWTDCSAPSTHGPALDRNAIYWGIEYLRGLSGQAQRGPGPRSCGRVSCSWNSAIWYCNNNSYTKYMPWYHIANAAEVLWHNCQYFLSNWWFAGWVIKGERWHDDGWFVIIAEEGC
ncbi:hypothetical protein QBC38DRAFT_363874 [Podospora fimiseda]|uniref:Secreted protein n=1 Tax=Podospora fimiseda TaxID=252190 RepID=A0AAN7BQK8_9PEZI|nr:hypothetical protein QBC38DRAFT_363874 [Podospora fimiseda]